MEAKIADRIWSIAESVVLLEWIYMRYFTLYSRDTSPVKELHSYEVAVQLGDHPITQSGERLLGATCVTDDEVDHRINGLIKNLEEIRVVAKKKLGANKA